MRPVIWWKVTLEFTLVKVSFYKRIWSLDSNLTILEGKMTTYLLLSCIRTSIHSHICALKKRRKNVMPYWVELGNTFGGPIYVLFYYVALDVFYGKVDFTKWSQVCEEFFSLKKTISHKSKLLFIQVRKQLLDIK